MSNKDHSTIAHLAPNHSADFSTKLYRNASRNQGSYLLNLRAPSRTPEYSRRYVPGDPVRMIDWKAFARTDQLLIREKRDEASALACIVVDFGETMNWPNAEVKRVVGPPVPARKIEVAMRVGLHLAYAHLQLGDRVIFLLQVNDEGLPSIRLPMHGSTDALSFYQGFVAEGFQREMMMAHGTQYEWAPKGIDACYWIGDGLSQANFDEVLGYGKHRYFLHLLCSLETNIDWLNTGYSYFDNGSQLKEFQGKVLASGTGYAEAVSRWRTKLASKIGTLNAHFVKLNDQATVDELHRCIGIEG